MKNVDVKEKTNESGVAMALDIIGWLIIVLGFIAGIILGRVESSSYARETEFSFSIAIIYWFAGTVPGIFFIAMGKIIELLTVIANKEYIIVDSESEAITKSES